MALPSEDSTCAICDDSEGENSNAIVFCDGCNLAVHQDCYGVPYIPEGQWLCRKCTVSPEVPVVCHCCSIFYENYNLFSQSCMLCPNEGGAFKQTVNGEWVHLLCAIWVPETRVANEVLMEPITGVEKINKQRWKLVCACFNLLLSFSLLLKLRYQKCSLCGIKEGACIQCSKTSCFLAFHTTCARREKLLMPMKSAHGTEPATLACYCEKHLPVRRPLNLRVSVTDSYHLTERTT
jgi:NuA3 HAT complex component NTO1